VRVPRAGGRLGYPSPPTPCTSTGDRLACPLLFPHVLNPMRRDFGVGSAINSRMASKTTRETRKGSGVFSRRNIIAILSTFTPEGRLDLSPTAHVQRGSLSNTICLLAEWSRLPFTVRIERAHSDRARSASTKGTWPLPSSFQAHSFFLQGWGLIDLPLRASNEGSLRPRVARAQKIIRLHPLLCSASKKGAWPRLSFRL
jgi:hypothetical protein